MHRAISNNNFDWSKRIFKLALKFKSNTMKAERVEVDYGITREVKDLKVLEK